MSALNEPIPYQRSPANGNVGPSPLTTSFSLVPYPTVVSFVLCVSGTVSR